MIETQSHNFFISDIIESNKFFDYHGLILTITWFVICTCAIVVKKWNFYLHGIGFLIVDILTFFFAIGAWINVAPNIKTFWQWDILTIIHVIGGSAVLIILIIQNVFGIMIRFGKQGQTTRRDHKVTAFIVSNFARLVACLGWIMGHYYHRTLMMIITLFLAAIFLAYSIATTFYGFGAHKWYGLGKLSPTNEIQNAANGLFDQIKSKF